MVPRKNKTMFAQNLGDKQRVLWYFPKWPIVLSNGQFYPSYGNRWSLVGWLSFAPGWMQTQKVLPEVYITGTRASILPEVEHLSTIYSSLMAPHITRNMLLVFLVWDKCLHNYWTIWSKAESRTPCPKIRPLFYLSFMALHITRNMLLVFLVWHKCLHNHCSIWSEVHSRTPSPNIQWPSKETSKSAHRLELVDVSSYQLCRDNPTKA